MIQSIAILIIVHLKNARKSTEITLKTSMQIIMKSSLRRNFVEFN